MTPTPLAAEHLLVCGCELGEAPLWHVSQGRLYWLDIAAAQLHTWDYNTTNWRSHALPASASALALYTDGANEGLLLAMQDELVLASFQGVVLQRLATLPALPIQWRFNDGKVDQQGRLWIGTLDSQRQPHNALFRYDGELVQMDGDYAAANGIAWSSDERTLYIADSPRRTINAYHYDAINGEISHRRIFVTMQGEQVPDGLTVDSEGGVWCACWGGWQVLRYDPDGTITHRVALPVQFPTSCTFGGEALDELFITSAWTRVPANQRLEQPLAGDLFRVHVPFVGQATAYVALNESIIE